MKSIVRPVTYQTRVLVKESCPGIEGEKLEHIFEAADYQPSGIDRIAVSRIAPLESRLFLMVS